MAEEKTKPVSNYELLVFLQNDGGRYSCSELIELLQNEFPNDEITRRRVINMRDGAIRSKYANVDVKLKPKSKTRERIIKVISVSDGYQKTGGVRTRGVPISNRKQSYLEGNHKEVETAVKTRMMFDQLLSGVRP